MIEKFNIRDTYEPGDIGYITYLHGLLYDFGPHFEYYVAETLADFYKNLNPERERMWIAEFKGQIVGSIALKDNKDGAGQLRYFLLHPEHRGLGLGNKLMEIFMDQLRDLGYSSSFLLTEEGLRTATHIYEKYGYQYVSSNTLDFGLTERRYELVL